jgi:hypothetical protein
MLALQTIFGILILIYGATITVFNPSFLVFKIKNFIYSFTPMGSLSCSFSLLLALFLFLAQLSVFLNQKDICFSNHRSEEEK